MFKTKFKIKKILIIKFCLLSSLSCFYQVSFSKSKPKKQSSYQTQKSNYSHNYPKRDRSSEPLPVLVFDIHGTFMYQQNNIAISALLKAGPVNMLRFLRRYHRYKKARDQQVTELPSVEAWVTGKNTGGRYEEMVQKAMSCYLPIPSAVLHLQQLKLDGYKLFIFSNIGEKSYSYLVDKFPELFKLFDGVVITPRGASAKTSPHAYHRCIKTITDTLGYDPGCIVLFDDYEKNCIMARQIDRRFIPVLCDRRNIEDSYKSLLGTLARIQENRKANLSDTVCTLNVAN